MYDTAYTGALANMLVGVATYDATIAAWNAKYQYKRPRPFESDPRIKLFALKPQSPISDNDYKNSNSKFKIKN